jgi:imidazolonepropionase-like amidohydrolase
MLPKFRRSGAIPSYMHKVQRAAFSLGILACLYLGHCEPGLAADAPKVLYVRCGKLIADASKPVSGPAAMVIADGKITAIGTAVAAPADAQQLDLSNSTCVPGFVDAHIHLWTGARGGSPSDGLAALRAQKAMAYALHSGITAVRVLGSAGFTDVALKDAIDEGTIPGPHIVPAGHGISIPAGHGDHFTLPASIPMEEYYTPLNGFINSVADAEKAVHLQIKYGARVIKIMASGGVGSPLDSFEAEQVSPEELRTIVEQAHMARIKVAAHDENLPTILEALHAGIDSLEHGSELNQEAVDFMKQHHVVLVPTVYIVDNIVQNGERDHLPDYMVRKAKELSVKHFASFQLATKSGVTIAAGSDQSYEPGKGTVLDEMITEVKLGMTPQQALISATKKGAALLGFDNLGSLEVGKEGSFVALDGDPLADIQAVKRTKAVVFQGKIVN